MEGWYTFNLRRRWSWRYSTATTFAFPDDSDLTNWYGTGGINAGGAWSEITEGITKFDRRMLNAVGPFNLNAGQTEVITFAVISAKDLTGDNLTSLEKLKLADDTIQSLAMAAITNMCSTSRNLYVFKQCCYY